MTRWRSPALAQPEAAARADDFARLSATLDRLHKLYVWGDIDANEYQRRKAEIEMERVKTGPPAPTPLADLQRAGALMQDLGRWWASEGLSAETRRDMVNEVFDSIDLDKNCIQAVQPRDEYKLLVETAQLGVDSGRGERI